LSSLSSLNRIEDLHNKISIKQAQQIASTVVLNGSRRIIKQAQCLTSTIKNR
jgi:hypothetical protein